MFGNKKPNLQQIFKDHKDELMMLVRNDFPSTQVADYFKSMELCHVDLLSRKYFMFGKTTLEPPMERIGKAQDYTLMMAAGLDDTELNELISLANEQMALSFAGKQNNAMVTIGAVFKAIQERKQMVLHIDLMYELAAVWIIREDELPHVWNDRIHKEKVATFKEEIRHDQSYNFFFQLPQLQLVKRLSNCTEQEWIQLCQESERQIAGMRNWIQYLQTSVKKSGIVRKTSANT